MLLKGAPDQSHQRGEHLATLLYFNPRVAKFSIIMQEPLATDMDIKDEILTDDEKRSGVYLTKNGRVRKDRTTNYVYGSGPGSKKVISM